MASEVQLQGQRKALSVVGPHALLQCLAQPFRGHPGNCAACCCPCWHLKPAADAAAVCTLPHWLSVVAVAERATASTTSCSPADAVPDLQVKVLTSALASAARKERSEQEEQQVQGFAAMPLLR